MEKSQKQDKFDSIIDYEEIYKVFGANVKADLKAGSNKKYLRRKLHEFFPGKTWYELSDSDKKRFIYVKVKDHMLNKVTPKTKLKKVTDEINKMIEYSMIDKEDALKTNSELLEREFYASKKYANYKDEGERNKAIKKDYKAFKEAFEQLIPQIIPPTLEQWIADNEKTPLLIKDYKLYPILNPDSEIVKRKQNTEQPEDVKAPQSDVDHLILMTIVKILKECQIADIDVAKIEKCSSVINSFLECPVHPMILEYDSSLNMSKEMQEEYITECRNYITYSNMCENLDFYELLGNYKEIANKKANSVKLDYEY